MTQTLDRRTIMNEAGKAGIALGGLVVICMAIVAFMPKGNGVGGAALFTGVTAIVWLVKFLGCIWLMQFFMKKLVKDYTGVNNVDTLKLGMWSAFFSALIVAAASMAEVMFINPDSYQDAIREAINTYSVTMDSNMETTLDNIIDKMPVISFFSNLIYCFVYGWILSLILSRRIPTFDPFANSQ